MIDENVRQQGSDENQKKFRTLLDNIRVGEFNESDYELIKTRFFDETPESLNRFKYLKSRCISLYFRNSDVDKHNWEVLMRGEHEILRFEGINSPDRAKNIKGTNEVRAPNNLFLSINSRVMLIRNMNTAAGLCNGSLGTVRKIIFESDDFSEGDLPLAVVVEFDKLNGTGFLGVDRWVPITPFNFMWKHRGQNFSRMQIPLVLANAITIHKSQGQTMDAVHVSLEGTENKFGLGFVGLSRVKNFENLLVSTCAYANFTKFKTQKNFIKLKEFYEKILEDHQHEEKN